MMSRASCGSNDSGSVAAGSNSSQTGNAASASTMSSSTMSFGGSTHGGCARLLFSLRQKARARVKRRKAAPRGGAAGDRLFLWEGVGVRAKRPKAAPTGGGGGGPQFPNRPPTDPRPEAWAGLRGAGAGLAAGRNAEGRGRGHWCRLPLADRPPAFPRTVPPSALREPVRLQGCSPKRPNDLFFVVRS